MSALTEVYETLSSHSMCFVVSVTILYSEFLLFSETTCRGSTNTCTEDSQEKAIIKSASLIKKKNKDGK